ncbi:MAG: DUF11 domain-containing protein, partial [bacterium]|nr:DUF11 domain-containing protein [bacterium]
VAWGDWDGDGDLDLAVGNEGEPNRVYENSEGGLTPVWDSAESDYTWNVAWGDWDGDGDLDLAVGNAQYQPDRVYGNIGGDLIPAWTSPHTDYSAMVAWGDWDGDGDLDLAVGCHSGPNRLYENIGADLISTWSSDDSAYTYPVAWGDWDGDGDLDLAAANCNQSTLVYSNTGGLLSIGWTSADPSMSVVWGDWDGDGDLDLATTAETPDPVVRVYSNGVLNRPGRLPETPVSPVIPRRPGTTDAAFFHSSGECLRAPLFFDYSLVDEESDLARRIVLEYSSAGGGSWSPATEFWSDGTEDVTASPGGEPHVFAWDALADGVVYDHDVVFRITVPYQASKRLAGPIQRAAMSATSPPFRICEPAADLAITKTNGLDTVVAGESVEYTIAVSNSGPYDVTAACVTDVFPPDINDVTWTCDDSTGGGSCGSASGSGNIDETVDLPRGTSVSFTANGTIDPGATGTLENTATVAAPAAITDLDPGNNSATDADSVVSNPVAVTTLILAHPTEMELTPEQAAPFLADLRRLASQPQVSGMVIDLGDYSTLESLYANWDGDPGNSDLANAVLFAPNGIHDIILGLLANTYPNVEYLILVGGDQVIPFARFSDETCLSESAYTDSSNSLYGLSPNGTTVGRALADNRYLSDDPLAMRQQVRPGDLSQDTFVSLPDLAVGRLVESPADITTVINSFIGQNGVLDLTLLDEQDGHKVLVTGFHFLIDVALRIKELWIDKLGYFGSAIAPVNGRLIGDDWDEAELLSDLCGAGDGLPYRLMNLNGAATHWELGVPGSGAGGFHGLPTTGTSPETYLLDPDACNPGALQLSGNLMYTNGSHAGLSVQPSTDPNDETLDLPEALNSLGLTAYLANTGFGWGLMDGIGYSEWVVQLFTEELISAGTTTVGEAVKNVKHRYWEESLRFEFYDEKTLRQWQLFGIPNLQLRVAGRAGLPEPEGVGSTTVRRHLSKGVRVASGVAAELDRDLPDALVRAEIEIEFQEEAYTKRRASGVV